MEKEKKLPQERLWYKVIIYTAIGLATAMLIFAWLFIHSALYGHIEWTNKTNTATISYN